MIQHLIMNYKDQLNRSLNLLETPKRIISLVPSQTELLVDLGLESALVGITKFCVHPNHLKKEKTIVGGTKQINIKKIAALQPDIILCNKEENTKDMITELEHIAPVHVSDIYTIDDCLKLIDMYGDLFLVQNKALQITQHIKKNAEAFKASVNGVPKRKVAYLIWKNPWMVAGSNTFINHLLELNNFENVFSELKRYPEINIEAIGQNKLDVILLSSEPYPFKEKHKRELSAHAKNAKFILVDGEYFSWYGSRLIGAFDYFTMLHQTVL